VQVVINLTDFLIDLTQSSCLSKNSHPSNPASLIVPAVMMQVKEGGASKGAFVSQAVGNRVVQQNVLQDLWGSIKELFCELANIKVAATGVDGHCGGTGSPVKNDRAIAALQRMEGGGAKCYKSYKHGVKLVPRHFNQPLVQSAVAEAICNATVDSYANTTFWDKLIGEFCPMFGIAVVPLIGNALVIADTPAYNGTPWRTIDPDEYDSADQTAFVERPLRAVGVYGNFGSFTGAANGPTTVNHTQIGGCYSEDSVRPADGLVQYIRAPRWLDGLMAGSTPDASTGNATNRPTNTPTTPGLTPAPGTPTYAKHMTDVEILYRDWAQHVYAMHSLRGRTGTISGKLRFDIGPGSVVRIRARPDATVGAGIDKLAADYYACVSRVKININAEGSACGTEFQLTHLRTEQENRLPRTSVNDHALFGKSIHGGGKHGAPLLDDYGDLE
jgi:hypothetical protein